MKINISNNIDKNIFTTLVVGIFLCIFLYVYFVSTSVVNIVQRKNIEVETQILGSNLSNLENEYISLNKNITLSYARSLGFVEPTHLLFISSGPSFAMNLGKRI